MSELGASLVDIGYMDTLAAGSTPLHRLDPRAKLLTTALFIVAVVSFGKYEVSALLPFLLYPVYLAAEGRLPARYLFKKVLLVSPFAVMVGIFNPFFDGGVLLRVGHLGVSGGWVSFASILLRFLLTVSAALALLALTGINSICEGLLRLGAPRAFVVQLLFLNRYLFSLAAETENMTRARALRSAGKRGMRFGVFIQILGHLLLKTLDRAERVYRAMLARGFDGHIRVTRGYKIGRRELLFFFCWTALFALFRFVNLPVMLGQAVTGLLK
ncbi:MAG: cobalt ECF transporter T component CbiQ [Elusimicrobia bacterium GWC2_61_19]|nr:MAG: cobalt ECF transporter T component CbiQ [Elusimicrobia bacterium GWC2_61_19]